MDKSSGELRHSVLANVAIFDNLIIQVQKSLIYRADCVRFHLHILSFRLFEFAAANRTNQCNPTHKPTGPGHQAAYQGNTTPQAINNHANQMNPNNPNYGSGRK